MMRHFKLSGLQRQHDRAGESGISCRMLSILNLNVSWSIASTGVVFTLQIPRPFGFVSLVLRAKVSLGPQQLLMRGTVLRLLGT